MKKVQEKDKSQEDGEIEVAVFSTQDELVKALEADPELNKEFLEDTSKDNKDFLEKHVKADEPEKKPDEEIEVAPELKKAEETIEVLQNEKLPALSHELEQSKAKEADLLAKIEALEKPAKKDKKKQEKLPDIDIPEISIPDIGKPDMFTAEGQGEVLDILNKTQEALKGTHDALIKTNERNKLLEQRLDDFDSGISQVQEDIQTTKDTTDRTQLVAENDKQISDEFKAIDNARKDSEVIFGEFKRSTKAIEDDYLAHVKDLAETAGLKGSLYKDGGDFTDDVTRVVNYYDDPKSATGKELREKCKVKPPEDYDVLQMIYSVRRIKNVNFERDSETGKIMPISYEKATSLFLAENPKIKEKVEIEKQKSEHQRQEKAVEKRKSFAKEAPVNEGVRSAMDEKTSSQELMKIMNKPASERTKEETAYAKTSLEALDWPADEIETVLARRRS